MFIIYSKDPVKNNQNQENRKGLNIHILSFSICISKRTQNVKQNDNEQFEVLFVETHTFGQKLMPNGQWWKQPHAFLKVQH